MKLANITTSNTREALLIEYTRVKLIETSGTFYDLSINRFPELK
jgi:hypothetical protein